MYSGTSPVTGVDDEALAKYAHAEALPSVMGHLL